MGLVARNRDSTHPPSDRGLEPAGNYFDLEALGPFDQALVLAELDDLVEDLVGLGLVGLADLVAVEEVDDGGDGLGGELRLADVVGGELDGGEGVDLAGPVEDQPLLLRRGRPA